MTSTATVKIGGKDWTLTPFSVAEFRAYIQLKKEYGAIYKSGNANDQDVLNFAEGLAKLILASIGRAEPTATIEHVESLSYAEIIAAVEKIVRLSGSSVDPNAPGWKVN